MTKQFGPVRTLRATSSTTRRGLSRLWGAASFSEDEVAKPGGELEFAKQEAAKLRGAPVPGRIAIKDLKEKLGATPTGGASLADFLKRL